MTQQGNDSFDPRKAFAEALEGQTTSGGPSLTFADKCAALCCLRGLMKRSVVMRAFGITGPTASYLANCVELPSLASLIPEDETGRQHPLPQRRGYKTDRTKHYGRYLDVAHEFNQLGEALFMQKYYTDEVHQRILRAKYLNEDKTKRGSNPKADKYAFDNHGPIRTNEGLFRIEWRVSVHDPNKGGWFYNCTDENGEVPLPTEQFPWRGQETLNSELRQRTPFRTSAQALNALLTATGDRK